MNSIDIKSAVESAIAVAWPDFAREHPHLAAAIDQQLLAEQAVQSIADDPQFQQTLAQASTANMVASGITELLVGFVAQWIKKLI